MEKPANTLSQKIITLLNEADDTLSTKEIRDYFVGQYSYSTVRKTLSKLVKADEIERLGEGFYVPKGTGERFKRQKALLGLCSLYKLPYRRVRALIDDLVRVI